MSALMEGQASFSLKDRQRDLCDFRKSHRGSGSDYPAADNDQIIIFHKTVIITVSIPFLDTTIHDRFMLPRMANIIRQQLRQEGRMRNIISDKPMFHQTFLAAAM